MSHNFNEAARLFNSGQYFQAHESWETLWRQKIEESDRLTLQGLIQIAAGLHKLYSLKQTPGVDYLLRQGLKKLRDNEYEGHNVKLLRRQIRALLKKIQEGAISESEKFSASLEPLK
ncbi:MAG: DUF309 domain-containing protein [Elusimicrobia bacterium]|nr:DUF309 domain-containing protein [Elusimicrobiota bacterium]